MQTSQAISNFKCCSNCKHKECQRHAELGIIDKNLECDCPDAELAGSTIFLENVIDLSHTLAQIMILCGIHECKAKTAVDIVTYAFLHYDLVCYCLEEKPKKRLRKEDIFHELGRKCLMNRVEARLAYIIVKRGFKAFYYKPQAPVPTDGEGRPLYSDECVYVHAARKTAETFGQFDGLSCEEQHAIEAKIRVCYKKFYDRMQSRKAQPGQDECNCCFCSKQRGNLVYGKPPPCASKPPEKKKPHKCPHCCKKKKQRFIHPKKSEERCPVCHRSRKCCTCVKYDYGIEWVRSIWERTDMNMYYMSMIDSLEEEYPPTCRPQFADICGDDDEEFDEENFEE